jgi:hypothetical protein
MKKILIYLLAFFLFLVIKSNPCLKNMVNLIGVFIQAIHADYASNYYDIANPQVMSGERISMKKEYY